MCVCVSLCVCVCVCVCVCGECGVDTLNGREGSYQMMQVGKKHTGLIQRVTIMANGSCFFVQKKWRIRGGTGEGSSMPTLGS